MPRLLHFVFFICSLGGISFAQVDYGLDDEIRSKIRYPAYTISGHEYNGDTLCIGLRHLDAFDTIIASNGDSLVQRSIFSKIYCKSLSSGHLDTLLNLSELIYTNFESTNSKLYWVAVNTFLSKVEDSLELTLYYLDKSTLELDRVRLFTTNEGISHGFRYFKRHGDILVLASYEGSRFEGDDWLILLDTRTNRLITKAKLEWPLPTVTSDERRIHSVIPHIVGTDTTVYVTGYSGISRQDSVFIREYDLSGSMIREKKLSIVFFSSSYEEKTTYSKNRSYLIDYDKDSLFFIGHSFDFDIDDWFNGVFNYRVLQLYKLDQNLTFLDSAVIQVDSFHVDLMLLNSSLQLGDTLIFTGEAGASYLEDSLKRGYSGDDVELVLPRDHLAILAVNPRTLSKVWHHRVVASVKRPDLVLFSTKPSPTNYFSVAYALPGDFVEEDQVYQNHARLIHFNKHGCPSADPNKTCDELIFLDSYVLSIDDPARREEAAVPSIRAYPNLLAARTVNTLQLEIPEAYLGQHLRASVYSVQGAQLQTIPVDYDGQLQVPGLSSGIYFLLIESSSRQVGVARVVVR